MLRAVHKHLLGRSAAALVALALSGAVQLAAAPRADAGQARSCRCPGHATAHACECGAVRGGRSVRAHVAPGCHRGGSREALAPGEQDRTARAPCVQGTCGLPEAPRAVTPRIAESFLVPRQAPLLRQERAVVLESPRGAELVAPACPEAPPPRFG